MFLACWHCLLGLGGTICFEHLNTASCLQPALALLQRESVEATIVY